MTINLIIGNCYIFMLFYFTHSSFHKDEVYNEDAFTINHETKIFKHELSTKNCTQMFKKLYS